MIRVSPTHTLVSGRVYVWRVPAPSAAVVLAGLRALSVRDERHRFVVATGGVR